MPSDADVSALVTQTCAAVQGLLSGNGLQMSNMISTCSILMQLVETIPQITGAQKKQIVIQVLHMLVNGDTAMPAGTQADLNAAVDIVVGPAIDFVIAAANGQIPLLNDAESAVKSCFAKMGPQKK